MRTKRVEIKFSEPLPKLYVYAPANQAPSELYLYEQAKEYLKQLNPNTIFSATITDEVFNYFCFYVVDYHIELFSIDIPDDMETINTDDLLKYVSKQLSPPYLSSDTNKWTVTVTYSINESKLKKEWELKRLERNNLLFASDWVESSEIVSDITKQKYRVYRQILRDSINFASYPHTVVFPKPPDIVYINDLQILNNELLDERALAYLKDYQPEENVLGWSNFLVDWKSYNFTNQKQFVGNLINLHTGFDLDSILASIPPDYSHEATDIV